jgi:hypothetical protein
MPIAVKILALMTATFAAINARLFVGLIRLHIPPILFLALAEVAYLWLQYPSLDLLSFVCLETTFYRMIKSFFDISCTKDTVSFNLNLRLNFFLECPEGQGWAKAQAFVESSCLGPAAQTAHHRTLHTAGLQAPQPFGHPILAGDSLGERLPARKAQPY